MNIRVITETEVYKLHTCVLQLSEYHNQVSANFKGFYPSRPVEETLKVFAENLKNHISRIAVIEDSEMVIGFCKIDIIQSKGKVDYLVVLQERRGKGYGTKLMDWAMEAFHKNDVKCIEVKVVDGNDAIHFYEKHGFKVNAYLMWNCEE